MTRKLSQKEQMAYSTIARLEAERDALREEVKTLLHGSVKEEVFDIVCRERDTLRAQLAEQSQGEPVAWLYESPADLEPVSGFTRCPHAAERFKETVWTVTPVFTHADSGEVESLKADKQAFAQNAIDLRGENERLRKELRIALSDINVEQRVSHSLRQHKTDYMEAAEETRKALRAQLDEANTAAEQLLQSRDIAREQVARKDTRLAERDALEQAVKSAGRVAHLYNSGSGMLAWIEGECSALSDSAELSGPTWTCDACQIEHPTNRPCDLCGGQTELGEIVSIGPQLLEWNRALPHSPILIGHEYGVANAALKFARAALARKA